MKYGIVGSGLALLGGAAVGAALMYLLDPEEGEHRRRNLAAHGSHAVHSAGSRVGGAWEELADYAHQVTEHVSDHATHVAEKARELGSSASDAASDKGHRFVDQAKRLRRVIAAKARQYAGAAQEQVASAKAFAEHAASEYLGKAHDAAQDVTGKAKIYANQARGIADQAQDYVDSTHDQIRRRVRSALHQDEPSHAAGYTLTGIGAVALGLGALYLFDSERGAERRRSLLGHAHQYLGDTGIAFRHTGEYLARQWDSVIKEVRHLAGTSDEVSNPGGPYGAPEGGGPVSQQNEGSSLHMPHLTSGSRLVIGLAGGSLGFYGAVRRDWVGMGAGLLGIGMIATGLAGIDYHAWSERARQYGNQLSDQAKQYGSTLTDQASHLRQKAHIYGQQLTQKAGEWSGQARDLANQGLQKAQELTQRATEYVQQNTASTPRPESSPQPQA